MKKIVDFIKKYNMLPPGSRVLVAVSGGADSVSLLYILNELSLQLDISVCAAHFNHLIRGKEADRDADFTQNLCNRLGIPFCCECGDVPGFAKAHSLSIEEAGRILRYDFLERARQQFGADRIATAHNQDDNTETVIMNLVRGAGMSGLSGIPPVRDRIIRPLLCLSRAEIEEYLSSKSIPFVTDSTNLSDDYLRNKIRHNVIPVLCELNAGTNEHFFNTSLMCREDEKYLMSVAETFIKENELPDGMPAEKISQLPYSISSRVIRILSDSKITSAQTDAVLNLLDSGVRTARLDLSGARAYLSQGILSFGCTEYSPISETELAIDQTVELNNPPIKISLNVTTFDDNIHKSFTDFLFKTSDVYGRIIVRSRLPGDQIHLRGTNCTKSLKKLFNEKHIPEFKRISVPVICDDLGILAISGVGCSERGKPEFGDTIYIINIRENNNHE